MQLTIPVCIRQTNEAYDFEVESTDTIGDLKQQIEEELGIPVDQQELSGIEYPQLRDNQTLAGFGEKSPIYLLRKEFKVIVEDMDEQDHDLMVNGTDTVLNFKYQIKGRTKISVDGMRLIFEGHPLEDESTLDECEITTESKIFLTSG